MLKIKNYVSRHRMTLGVSGLLAVVALASSMALSVAASSSDIPPSTPQIAPKAQAASPAIAAQLSIFTRPMTAVDALPAATEGNPAHWLKETRVGANGALARRAQAGQHGAIYLIPSTQGVCMFDAAGSENVCATAAEVENGEAQETILCAPSVPQGQIEIGGILPDGTSHATLLFSTGATEPLTVDGNTYVVDFPRSGPLPTALQWISGNGVQHIASTHVPADVASEDCVAPPR